LTVSNGKDHSDPDLCIGSTPQLEVPERGPADQPFGGSADL